MSQRQIYVKLTEEHIKTIMGNLPVANSDLYSYLSDYIDESKPKETIQILVLSFPPDGTAETGNIDWEPYIDPLKVIDLLENQAKILRGMIEDGDFAEEYEADVFED